MKFILNKNGLKDKVEAKIRHKVRNGTSPFLNRIITCNEKWTIVCDDLDNSSDTNENPK